MSSQASGDRMYTLRPAAETDMPTIRWLVRIGQINPTGLRRQRFIVAESSAGEVIGCGQIKSHRDGSKELASLAVHPDWRGQGVARAMIEHLIDAHPGDLYLMCRAKLGPMYEKFDFFSLELEQMPRYFQRILRLLGFLDRLRDDRNRVLIMKRAGDA
jgi:GNAT superfamily N-acetyltransferase